MPTERSGGALVFCVDCHREVTEHGWLDDILATLDAWVRSRPAPKRTLRQIVLERLEEAGPKGSKALRSETTPKTIFSATSASRRLG